jgi:hypothetical protein
MLDNYYKEDNTMQIRDIEAGNSYACKFKVKTFVDSQGNPVDTRNLQVGEKVAGLPGEYTGFGVIQVRDVDNRLVEVWDTELEREWTVGWEDCWDVDTVEWTDS